ncbi:helix-turn-helix domain-containing protein [Flagellimonas flava]|uniref:helix-turn-helix domain-containing protein n=1 Tax=Flagellimonas flava TaxID=570519 RepID=UPI003D660315
MFLEHQHFDISDKPVLQRFKFNTPLKLPVSMDNEACFILAVHGRASIYSRTNVVDANGEHAVLVRCGKYINKWKKVCETGVSEAIIIRFYPKLMKKIFTDVLPKGIYDKLSRKKTGPAKHNDVHSFKVDRLLKAYIKSLMFYFEAPELMTDELIELKLKELILLLVNSERSGDIADILSQIFDNEEYSLKQIVETHLFEDLMMEDYASLCNMSLSSFQRKFKKTFDETPGRYILIRRLEKGAELLKVSKESISAISYQCGFSDPTYFTKAFKKKFGKSPRDFRTVK